MKLVFTLDHATRVDSLSDAENMVEAAKAENPSITDYHIHCSRKKWYSVKVFSKNNVSLGWINYPSFDMRN